MSISSKVGAVLMVIGGPIMTVRSISGLCYRPTDIYVNVSLVAFTVVGLNSFWLGLTSLRKTNTKQ